jgi:hypothetical protein
MSSLIIKENFPPEASMKSAKLKVVIGNCKEKEFYPLCSSPTSTWVQKKRR